ncbi:DOMON domain-containing protein FRRS1L-like [Saccoglossus kowalevskii]
MSVLCLSTCQALVDQDGCGVTKNCWENPTGCVVPDCDFLITWQSEESSNSTEFGLFGKLADLEHYLAIGFSIDASMPGTDVWACMGLSDSSIVLDHSYNPFYYNEQLSTAGAGNLVSTFADNTLECTFSRLHSNPGTDPFADLAGNSYYLQVARGPRLDSDPPKLDKHTVTPIVSPGLIDFTSNIYSGAPVAAIHGVVLFCSLICLAFIACMY